MALRLARARARLVVADIDPEALANTADECLAAGGRTMETLKAREVVHAIAESTWQCGDPGMQFDTVINVNLTGVFLCGREAAATMIETGSKGCIINISSISRAGNMGQTNYSAAKAGVEAMAVTWSRELARYAHGGYSGGAYRRSRRDRGHGAVHLRKRLRQRSLLRRRWRTAAVANQSGSGTSSSYSAIVLRTVSSLRNAVPMRSRAASPMRRRRSSSR